MKEIYEFRDEWEVSERKFVKLEDLQKYIFWSNGKIFQEQLDSAKKHIMRNIQYI